MAATRKLQGEIDRCHKKVAEGVETFEDIWHKVHNATNSNQKEKYEADLKKEIKKLQRLRDQLKVWIASPDIKDKGPLIEDRKWIETQMERFKVVERETKTKAYSKEGLGAAQKLDPAQKEREEISCWLVTSIDALNIQLDQFESEIESLLAGKKKRLDKDKQDRMDELKGKLEKHRFHIRKLETLLRMLDNTAVEVGQIRKIKDDVEYYIEASQEPDFEENEFIYDDIIGLDEIELSGVGLPSSATTDSNNSNDTGGTPTSTRSGGSPSTSPIQNLNHSSESPTLDAEKKKRDEQMAKVSPVKPTAVRASQQNSLINTSGLPGIKPVMVTPSKTSTGVAHSTPNNSSPSSLLNHSVGNFAAVAAANSHPAPPTTPTSNNSNNITSSKSTHSTENGTIPVSSPHSQPPSLSTTVGSSSNQQQLHHPAPQLSLVDTRPLGAVGSGSSTSNVSSTSTSNPPPHLQQASAGSTPPPAVSSNNQLSSIVGSKQLRMQGLQGLQGLVNSMDHHQYNNSTVNCSSPPSPVSSAASPLPTLGASAASLATASSAGPIALVSPSPVTSVPTSGLSTSSVTALPTSTPVQTQQQSGQPQPVPQPQLPLQLQSQPLSQQQQLPQQQPAQQPTLNGPNVGDVAGLSSLKSIAQQAIDRAGLEVPPPETNRSLLESKMMMPVTTEAHIPPLLGVAPLGPVPLQKEHQRQFQMLDAAFYHLPLPSDSEKLRSYLARTPCPSPPYYPQVPLPDTDSLEFYQRLGNETLFFIFYYMEGTKAQYLAAKALKKQSWRFHTKLMHWYQRHEEPRVINDEYEQGSYIFFDFDNWIQRRREGFTFEYKYLEDRDLN
ncbi:CCR4-NOT transcription complex subunit 3 [Thrips palmi]|uniref:CCR4-NOT transcription complex subunit 3 n=1 Tax=Thrips palmi TaxID=161013 RepID=A0A6P8YVS4_THRPL|nr:CCR4-NOT transcription complex subunit 3 [Thrips palmi]